LENKESNNKHGGGGCGRKLAEGQRKVAGRYKEPRKKAATTKNPTFPPPEVEKDEAMDRTQGKHDQGRKLDLEDRPALEKTDPPEIERLLGRK